MRTIEDQIGFELAKEHGGRLGFVQIYRPQHKCQQTSGSQDRASHRGSVENFLINPANQSGVWIIEIPNAPTLKTVAVRWNLLTQEWENLGKVKFGTL